MSIDEFIEEIEIILELDNFKLDKAFNLRDLDEYDSLSILAIISTIKEKFNIKLNIKQFSNVYTINDLINLIGIDAFNE